MKKFTIATNRTAEENLTILNNIVCIKRLPMFSSYFDYDSKPFYGTIEKNSFDIVPVETTDGSYAPVIRGHISAGNNSTLTIRIRLHLISISFFILFLAMLIYSLYKLEQSYMPFVFCTFFLPSMYSFSRHAEYCKAMLKKYFE